MLKTAVMPVSGEIEAEHARCRRGLAHSSATIGKSAPV
jgi:hypothetical protein